MSDLDFLNYKPNFERDKKEKTGWIEQQETPYISESESEEVYRGKEMDITISVDKYEKFKENFNKRVEKLEKGLQNIELTKNVMIEQALQESGHKSTFTPKSYRELFDKKETSVGEYLIGVLEKQIEGEYGDIKWEIFIEYLEIEEEIDILDFYMKKILYPIISKENSELTMEEIRELEEKWIENTINNITKFKIAEMNYKSAMISNPKKIAKRRDQLHELEKNKMLSMQEINQVESTLTTIDEKRRSLQILLHKIDEVLGIEINKKTINEFFSLTENVKEESDNVKNKTILTKQSIDQENKKKKELKESRRNLYSKNKQKRIIDEYSSINHLLRENSLPSVHYMKSFQDNATKELGELFNESAKSIMRNYNENKEKTYETFLLQISTSQTRMNRLTCIESKQKSRLMFKELINKYKEVN